jgi:tetratricopeptide (TPR) repeat protein
MLEAASEAIKRGAHVDAKQHLHALLDMEPTHELALGMLGAVHAELNELSSAMEYFQRTLDINTENALARFQLGFLLLETGQPQAALEAWRAGQYGPHKYLIDYYTGVALLQLEQRQDALTSFQLSQKSMPTDHALYPALLSSLIKLSNSP